MDGKVLQVRSHLSLKQVLRELFQLMRDTKTHSSCASNVTYTRSKIDRYFRQIVDSQAVKGVPG